MCCREFVGKLISIFSYHRGASAVKILFIVVGSLFRR